MTAPVARSPIHPLQTALYNRLTGDTQLMGMVTGGVHDEVPEKAAYPYVRIGEHISTPDNHHGGYGREVLSTLHVWTKARGNAQGQRIADRIVGLLDHQPAALTVGGHRVVAIRHEYDQALTDPTPGIRHHVLRFRIITDQVEE